MSYLVIRDQSGERTVDLTPVENIIMDVENAIEEGYGMAEVMQRIDDISDLNKDQLRHLFSYLTGATLRYAKLWHSACSNPDSLMETANSMREIERVTGEKIWPTLVNTAISE